MTEFIDTYRLKHYQSEIKSLQKDLKQWHFHAKKMGLTTVADFFGNIEALIELLTDDSERLDKLEDLNVIKTSDLRAWIDKQKVK